MTDDVAVIGLGAMGQPIARVLLAAGYPVRGWNRSALPSDPGVPLCATLAQAAAAQVCLLMLATPDAVAAVLAGLEPYLRPGQLVIDMSTSAPQQSRAQAARLAQAGVGWVDAPVSGGPEGAAAGRLAIMAGGSEHDVARARPLLERLGGVVRVGGPGDGHTAKLVNQLIVALTLEAVAEGLTLAERSGLDPRLVQQAMAGGFADSKLLQLHGTRMIERSYRPGGRAALQLKDLRLIDDLAGALGLELPHFRSVLERYATLVAAGDGDLDHSAIHKLLWQ